MKKIIFFLVSFTIINISKAQNVGIGINAPTDKLHVNAAAGANPLLIQINAVNKLRVNSNGGTTIGSTVVAPANGLYVAGVTNPVGGVRSSTNPINIESTNDSVEIFAGKNKVVVFANGGIKIVTANGTDGIIIDAGAGNLNLKASNITIDAANNFTLNAGSNSAITTGVATSISTGTNMTVSAIAGNATFLSQKADVIIGDINAKNVSITAGTNLDVTAAVSSSISTGATSTIITGSNMSLTVGGGYSIATGGAMGVTVGSNYTFLADGTADITSTGKYTLKPSAYDLRSSDIFMQSTGASRLNGAIVYLNNGTKGAARLGDQTFLQFTNGIGSIISSSATVLIGN